MMTFQPFALFLAMADLFFLWIAYHIAVAIRLGLSWNFHFGIFPPGTPVFLPFMSVFFLLSGVYASKRVISRFSLIRQLANSWVLLTLVLSVFTFIIYGEELKRFVGRGVFFIALVLFFIQAMILRLLLFRRYFSVSRKMTVGLDCSERSHELILKEAERLGLHWHFISFERRKIMRKTTRDSKNLKSRRDWLNHLSQHPPTIIVMEHHSLKPVEVVQLAAIRLSGTRVMDLAVFYEEFFGKIPLHAAQESGIFLMSGFSRISQPLGVSLKILTDRILAFLLLMVFLPVIFFVWVRIALETGFPVFFVQPRTGQNGEIFNAIKFRSMYIGSEKLAKYTSDDDPRITPVGRFLRKVRLDELPQLWNVIKGDMSLIGPRAEWVRLTEEYDRKIPAYNLRHLVKPGITGWAQVNYPYGANLQDTIHKLEYDLYYIRNYSFWLDMLILFRTVRVVLFGKGR